MRNLIKHGITLLLFISFGVVYAKCAEQKEISVDGGHIKYYQVGEGSPVLLLHGLFANKKQWCGIVTKLQALESNKYQFIIPDLAGYGASTDYPVEAYVLDSEDKNSTALNQINILHHFIAELGITQPMDIAGNSMGGLIMTLYAHHYPEQVKSLAYIGSPAGIAGYTDHFYDAGFRNLYNPFIPTTVDQFKEELKLLLVNYAAIMPPDEVIENKIIPKEVKNYQQFTAAFNVLNIRKYREYLTEKQAITQPVIVFWGEQDYIFGSTKHAKKLCENFKKCQTHFLPEAGHLVLLENEATLNSVAQSYYTFLNHNQFDMVP
jgi:pimeloyl-ACP methyl ester carboxylesterase